MLISIRHRHTLVGNVTQRGQANTHTDRRNTRIIKGTVKASRDGEALIIIMEICKAPTLRLKALNKHTHIMYIIKKIFKRTK